MTSPFAPAVGRSGCSMDRICNLFSCWSRYDWSRWLLFGLAIEQFDFNFSATSITWSLMVFKINVSGWVLIFIYSGWPDRVAIEDWLYIEIDRECRHGLMRWGPKQWCYWKGKRTSDFINYQASALTTVTILSERDWLYLLKEGSSYLNN